MTRRHPPYAATLNHYRDPAHVVHHHHRNGGAWCCIDIDTRNYGPPITSNTPLTCLWCLAHIYLL